jgi:transcriptional regulator with XRE-family HTH domain/quercetin dioxygenase-like cupin family protein
MPAVREGDPPGAGGLSETLPPDERFSCAEREPWGGAVPAGEVSALGERIREERLRRGMSLRGLARDVGVSASMISQIETGKTRPSVSTLYAITSALGITMDGVFSPRGDEESARAGAGALADPAADPFVVSAAGPVRDPVAATAPLPGPVAAARTAEPDAGPADALPDEGTPAGGPAAGTPGGVVVRAADRPSLTLETGVTWERLGEIAGHAVDFLLITYPPGGASSSTGGLMRHSGAEFGFVLSGELVLTLGFSEIRLRPGDAVSFPSTTPHGYRNDGSEPALGVWFVIERDVFVDEP